jgi:hypothetical protein
MKALGESRANYHDAGFPRADPFSAAGGLARLFTRPVSSSEPGIASRTCCMSHAIRFSNVTICPCLLTVVPVRPNFATVRKHELATDLQAAIATSEQVPLTWFLNSLTVEPRRSSAPSLSSQYGPRGVAQELGHAIF